MPAINTGPTATTLHHLLAVLHSATGIDPLWLVWGLVMLVVVIAVGVVALVDHYLGNEPISKNKGSASRRAKVKASQWY